MKHQLPNGEFEAVTKGRDPENINNVREIVRDMKGTDILTYEDLEGQHTPSASVMNLT